MSLLKQIILQTSTPNLVVDCEICTNSLVAAMILLFLQDLTNEIFLKAIQGIA